MTPDGRPQPARRARVEILVPARKVPVLAEADVLVCGGGTAGIAAACSAARHGCSVILLERWPSVGAWPPTPSSTSGTPPTAPGRSSSASCRRRSSAAASTSTAGTTSPDRSRRTGSTPRRCGRSSSACSRRRACGPSATSRRSSRWSRAAASAACSPIPRPAARPCWGGSSSTPPATATSPRTRGCPSTTGGPATASCRP